MVREGGPSVLLPKSDIAAMSDFNPLFRARVDPAGFEPVSSGW